MLIVIVIVNTTERSFTSESGVKIKLLLLLLLLFSFLYFEVHLIIYTMVLNFTHGAVQVLRNADGGGGG